MLVISIFGLQVGDGHKDREEIKEGDAGCCTQLLMLIEPTMFYPNVHTPELKG